jgi:hypothetical protein
MKNEINKRIKASTATANFDDLKKEEEEIEKQINEYYVKIKQNTTELAVKIQTETYPDIKINLEDDSEDAKNLKI